MSDPFAFLGEKLDVRPNIDNRPWDDITSGKLLATGKVTRIALVPNGTQGGKASVAVAIRTPQGWVIGETTWALMRAALHALEASPEGSPE